MESAGYSAAVLDKADGDTQARISDKEAAEWAGLLLGSLGQQFESPQAGLSDPKHSTESPQSAENSRNARSPQAHASTSTTPMTQSQSADTGGVNATGPDRLILNVNSETLGRVQLVVDRDEGGVRVVVGGEGDARTRLSEGKHALSEALSAAGVRVNSLRIVAAHEVGSVLAQDLLSKKSRPEAERQKEAPPQKDKSQKGKRNNLNLVG